MKNHSKITAKTTNIAKTVRRRVMIFDCGCSIEFNE
jgi:hypothetical protein